MARNKKIKGRRVTDNVEVEVVYKPDFSLYIGHKNNYTNGTPIIFCKCPECGKNYEFCDIYFPEEEDVSGKSTCLYCINAMKSPGEGKYDYILESDFVVENEDYDDSYLIDEDYENYENYENYDDEEIEGDDDGY